MKKSLAILLMVSVSLIFCSTAKAELRPIKDGIEALPSTGPAGDPPVQRVRPYKRIIEALPSTGPAGDLEPDQVSYYNPNPDSVIGVSAEGNYSLLKICLLEKNAAGETRACSLRVPVYVCSKNGDEIGISEPGNLKVLDYQATIDNGLVGEVLVGPKVREAVKIGIIAGPHPATGEVVALDYIVGQSSTGSADSREQIDIIFSVDF